MERLRVRTRLNAGDGRALPETVTLEGFEVATVGEFDILNALVQSNGNIRVIVDSESEIISAAGAGAGNSS
jgi:hypothetical protein